MFVGVMQIMLQSCRHALLALERPMLVRLRGCGSVVQLPARAQGEMACTTRHHHAPVDSRSMGMKLRPRWQAQRFRTFHNLSVASASS
jgi:hypothetical protein